MNKKIKVIGLLIKIAHGEYPKRFKYNNKIYEYKRIAQGTGYVTENYDWFNSDIYIDDWDNLNEYVEILEDTPKKIEKIKTLKYDTFNKKQKLLYENMDKLADKLNEIIDKINEMENNK